MVNGPHNCCARMHFVAWAALCTKEGTTGLLSAALEGWTLLKCLRLSAYGRTVYSDRAKGILEDTCNIAILRSYRDIFDEGC